MSLFLYQGQPNFTFKQFLWAMMNLISQNDLLTLLEDKFNPSFIQVSTYIYVKSLTKEILLYIKEYQLIL